MYIQYGLIWILETIITCDYNSGHQYENNQTLVYRSVLRQCTCIHTHTCTYIHTYTHTHIHTHIYTHKQTASALMRNYQLNTIIMTITQTDYKAIQYWHRKHTEEANGTQVTVSEISTNRKMNAKPGY